MHAAVCVLMIMIVAVIRCYEIKCDTGVVIGNYSTTNNDAAIPYNTSTGFIEPGLDYDTLKDDYNRTWNGNPLMSQDMLFAQCWNGSQVNTHLDLWTAFCASACDCYKAPMCHLHGFILLCSGAPCSI